MLVNMRHMRMDEYCMSRFSISEQDIMAHRRYSPLRRYTLIKEMAGEKFIEENNIFARFFGEDCPVEKVSDVSMQVRGVDYTVTCNNKKYNIDLKACIGPDYTFKHESCINKSDYIESMSVPLEVTQYGKRSYPKTGKLTDYLLYVVIDVDHEYACLIPYATVHNITQAHYIPYGVNKTPTYKIWASNNGTATYINVPAKKFAVDEVYIRRPNRERF